MKFYENTREIGFLLLESLVFVERNSKMKIFRNILLKSLKLTVGDGCRRKTVKGSQGVKENKKNLNYIILKL